MKAAADIDDERIIGAPQGKSRKVIFAEEIIQRKNWLPGMGSFGVSDYFSDLAGISKCSI